jgi:antitoxin MazE
MESEIVKIGNSQGIRIPKPLLKQAGLGRYVSIRAEDGKIIIENDEISGRELAIMSELALNDWNSKEEDEAWEYLDQVK